jgi:hypothetical protein
MATDASWLQMEMYSGRLYGTPTNDDTGTWEVTVTCSDGNSGKDIEIFNLTVVNVNDAPIIEYYFPSDEFPTVEEGNELSFNVTYSDEDSDTFTIQWTLDGVRVRSDVPFWKFQPAFETAGDHEVVVNITDSGGAYAQQRWIVIVTTANRAPVIDHVSPPGLKPILDSESSSITFSVNASDPDLNHLDYTWFVDGGDTGERTETFIFDRSRYEPGTYVLTVKINDDTGASVEQSWTVEVEEEVKDKDKDGGSGSTSDLTLYLLAAIAAIVVALVLVFLILKMKNKTEIEDIFVISNSGILMAHKTKELRPDMDDNILSGMLTAIQDFIKDAFKDKSKFGLRRLDFGDSVIHLKRGKGFYIAVVLSGDEPKNLEGRLDTTIKNIEGKYGKVLEGWMGNLSEVRGIKDELDLLVK